MGACLFAGPGPAEGDLDVASGVSGFDMMVESRNGMTLSLITLRGLAIIHAKCT